ncbi:acetyl-CoA carboxylase biotin carboxyl carrier protein subunit [Advenella sp. FME57]|uniref:Acetyl-CoA carboxylase biotin carboxyl carrier protein subunit n=1 Tax=Advenella kashmirensis TaxID=310575 RepID=A0A356LF40_9BURK|nr:acetyl-CoA carboxylase biotin carboxyl carrier protein subunit [Advenella sp. FME57]HBP29378.1 acetyl-CoA carboxylase biotin carboxyl carrier protein subunit [Advenella kashmirensis]
MKYLESSVAGRIISIQLQVGQSVTEGDEIAIIESMKMELPVEAEHSGTVIRVLAATGDEVDEAQALAEIEE